MELNHQMVLDILPDRKETAHKGDFGRILLLCGSRCYTGAPWFAAMGALRCGAGLVYLGVPESIYAIEATKLNEPIVFPLPEEDGTLSVTAIPKIQELLDSMDAVLIGPGLGQSEGTQAVVREVLTGFSGPAVVDADGINVLAQHKDVLRERQSPTILTPHPGEFARLGGDHSIDRRKAAMDFAKAYGCILVLKGHGTVITDGNRCYVNPTGNPGMAVGGSGDVLSGMIAGLIGQKIDPLLASACGAFLHGMAGDICAENMGQYGMLPSDMVEVLPRLLK